MDRILLITRSKHDATVRYLFYWAGKIIDLAGSKGIKVLKLDEKRANRKEVSGMLKKKNPLLVFLNGHGNDDRVTGYNNEVLLAAGENEQLLTSKIVYALSCRSGKKLGIKSIEAGSLGYIGYDDDFVFVIDDHRLAAPLEDKTAQLFLEPSNQVMISLLKGNSIKKSHTKSKRAFRANAIKLASSESQDNSLIPFLFWDMQHQVCLGNPDASL